MIRNLFILLLAGIFTIGITDLEAMTEYTEISEKEISADGHVYNERLSEVAFNDSFYEIVYLHNKSFQLRNAGKWHKHKKNGSANQWLCPKKTFSKIEYLSCKFLNLLSNPHTGNVPHYLYLRNLRL